MAYRSHFSVVIYFKYVRLFKCYYMSYFVCRFYSHLSLGPTERTWSYGGIWCYNHTLVAWPTVFRIRQRFYTLNTIVKANDGAFTLPLVSMQPPQPLGPMESDPWWSDDEVMAGVNFPPEQRTYDDTRWSYMTSLHCRRTSWVSVIYLCTVAKIVRCSRSSHDCHKMWLRWSTTSTIFWTFQKFIFSDTSRRPRHRALTQDYPQDGLRCCPIVASQIIVQPRTLSWTIAME